MDNIIELRKRVALLEKQLENALSWVTPLRRENERLLESIKGIAEIQVKYSPVNKTGYVGFGKVPLKEEGKPYRGLE
jgi:hypothetical protein